MLLGNGALLQDDRGRRGHGSGVRQRHYGEPHVQGGLYGQDPLRGDPVSVNRQGHDVGSQYRTGIYYVDPGDRPVIEEAWRAEQARHAQPLAVEKLPLVNFYAAEDYHQDYLEKNPRGYCHLPAALFKLAREAKPQNR